MPPKKSKGHNQQGHRESQGVGARDGHSHQGHSRQPEELSGMSLFGMSLGVLITTSLTGLMLAFVVYGLLGGWQQMLLEKYYVQQSLDIAGSQVKLQRGPKDKGGVFEIWADDTAGLMKGLGYVHAIDRMVAMALTRVVVQGRISELVAGDDPKAFAIDSFMRKQRFYKDALASVDDFKKKDARSYELLEAYTKGVNQRFDEVFGKKPIPATTFVEEIITKLPQAPLELTLLAGIKHLDPWVPADSLAILNIMGYLGLSEVQEGTEMFALEIIQQTLLNPSASSTRKSDTLRKLFYPHLEGLFTSPESNELLEYIKKVKLPTDRSQIPTSLWEIAFLRHDPKGKPIVSEVGGSNNWVISKNLSSTGGALMASDPHLEVSRLPAIWYEVVLHLPNHDFCTGITIPGVAGIAMGRTNQLSWSFTYGFMDMSDYFMVDCEGLTCKGAKGRVPIHVRKEVIHRKGISPVNYYVYETENGDIIETNATYVYDDSGKIPELEAGVYLSTAYTQRRYCEATVSNEAYLIKGITLPSVLEAQEQSKTITLSLNVLLADEDGNIGYQQTGMMPVRAPGHSGFYPLFSWNPQHAWKGVVNPDKLGRVYNPPEGYIATANDDKHTLQDPVSVNAHMGPYRRQRVEELIETYHNLNGFLDVNDMKILQRDILSLQAHDFCAVVDKTVDDLIAADESKYSVLSPLREWDLHYRSNSVGAALFEEFYARILEKIFGDIFSVELWRIMKNEYIFRAFFYSYDRLLLDPAFANDATIWRDGNSYKKTVEEILKEMADVNVVVNARKTFENKQSYFLQNILFEDKAPLFTGLLGFDQGPFPFSGGRATIVQFVNVETSKRKFAVGPSWRHISDMSYDGITLTCLPGGPSDQIVSELYAVDLNRYLANKYKRLPRFEDHSHKYLHEQNKAHARIP